MLYRLTYCSQSRLTGAPQDRRAALSKLLTSARRRNASMGLTGALVFSAQRFAQVLEGPMEAIEQVFELIQRDHRHGNVTVLDYGPVEARAFPGWSMAFASEDLEQGLSQPPAAGAAQYPATDAAEICDKLRSVVLQQDLTELALA